MKKNLILFSLAVISISIFINSCKKDSILKTTQPTNQTVTSTGNEGQVLTPYGWVDKSRTHLIESGYHLSISGGHVLKVQNKTNQLVLDLGAKGSTAVIKAVTGSQTSQNPLSRNFSVGTTSLSNSPWQAYASWEVSATAGPIQAMSTSWRVPPAPTYNDAQTIFIFNGISKDDQSDIMQPVLQWGVSAAGGGANYYMANWYVWTDASGYEEAAYSACYAVSPGATIVGAITYTGQQPDASYNYTVSFTVNGTDPGYDLNVTEGSQIPAGKGPIIPFIDEERYVYQALEVYNASGINGGYGPTSVSDYPALQQSIAMQNIQIQTWGGVTPTMTWTTASGPYAFFGEHAIDVSDNAAGSGEVDLYFSNIPVGGHTFNISSSGPSATYFMMNINGNDFSGPRSVNPGVPNAVSGAASLSPTSTVIMHVTTGYVPIGATLYGPGYYPGVISGNNITFTNVDLSTVTSSSLVLY